jgi:hypothetical protein
MRTNLSYLNQNTVNVNEACTDVSKTFMAVADTHAPLKRKRLMDQSVTYMNKTLKQAFYKKRMLQII